MRASLERGGTPFGALDTLIAAKALRLGVTLVTRDTRELQRVPGLAVDRPARRELSPSPLAAGTARPGRPVEVPRSNPATIPTGGHD